MAAGRRVRPGVTAVVACAVVLAGGCTRAVAPSPSPSADPGGPTTSSPGPGAPTAERPARRAPLVRIAVGGDVHVEGALRARLGAPSGVLGEAARVLAGADVAVVNLETSVGAGGRPEPGKRFTFSAPPSVLDDLAEAGVDVAVQANNHALDLGRSRLPSTLRAVAGAPLDVVGIGRDLRSALAPAVSRVGGSTVAVLAASVADQDPTADATAPWAATPTRGGIAMALDPGPLLRAVRRAAQQHDVVVAYLHWGIQGERCPSPDQRSLAARLVAAGADVVVGSHTHVLQGDGRLGPGYVAYGLGNLAWYSPGPTGVLTLAVRPPHRSGGRASVVGSTWWAGRIGTNGTASRLLGGAVAAFAAERAELRACTGLGQPR